MSQANFSSVHGRTDLDLISNMEILEVIRAMESRQAIGDSLEEDHRRHLSRDELLNVYRLTCRALELRRMARELKNTTSLVNH